MRRAPRKTTARRLAFCPVGLLALVLTASGTAAQDPVWPWFGWNYATGEWGGWRQDLNKRGIEPTLGYTADFLANPVGGLNQGSAYSAGLYISLDLDLQTLFGLKGTSFFVSGIWDQGRDLSDQSVGNFFDVSNAFNGRSVRAAQIYLQQDLWQDRFEIAIGRMAAGDDFAASDLYGYYVSAAINSNPTSLQANSASFAIAPLVQWGARITVSPSDDSFFSFGSYIANPSIEDANAKGLDFTFDPALGHMAIAELGYEDPLKGLVTDQPGLVTIGGYYDFADFDRLDEPSKTERGNVSIYVTAQQSLFQEEKDPKQGLTAWTALTFAPKQAVSEVPFAAYAGALYHGLLPNRSDDMTALGLYYASFSDRLEDQSYEFVVEANHRFQLAPWLYITPDVQFILNPGGGGTPNALVVGTELGIDF